MNRQQKYIVIKFGGSLITQKQHLDTLNPEALQSCAQYVAQCIEQGDKVCVVHGAGSYGHIRAASLKASWSKSSAIQKKEGIEAVQAGVLRLHVQVCNALSSLGLQPVSFLPQVMEDEQFLCNNIVQNIQAGNLVVTGGDMVWQGEDYHIIGGDYLVKSIATKLASLPATQVQAIFLTRTGGVLDTQGGVIPTMSARDPLPSMPLPYADVSGGMAEKVNVARTLVALGVHVTIGGVSGKGTNVTG